MDDILLQFKSGNNRDYYSFETFILNLLKFHVESLNRKFVVLENHIGVGNAVAEEGFGLFAGSTLIDIKMKLITSSLATQQNMFRLSNDRLQDFEYYLIIALNQPSSVGIRRFQKQINSMYPNVRVKFWGPNEIQKIINRHKKRANEIAGSLFSLRLENAVSKQYGNWLTERDALIEILRGYYERGQFSMFLGAGVSSSAGLPDWNTLINSLFVSYLTKEFDNQKNVEDVDLKQIVERLNAVDGPSALMSARYLRKGLSRQTSEIKDFTKTITENLYKLRDTSKSLNSELIVAISSMCMPRRTGAKVKSVVTYNFDDLLERELASKSIHHHSIYTNNETVDPDELPIYHVHGFLPEDVSKYEGLEKSTLVFSEEGYHQIYTDAYHWSNLVQLANLRDNNCVMIGLSLTDPNLRRLLDISARDIEAPRHFAFMRRIDFDRFAYKQDENEKVKLVGNLKIAEDFLDRHHRLNEEIMKELGVTIIWFNSFKEIPEILEKIFSYNNL